MAELPLNDVTLSQSALLISEQEKTEQIRMARESIKEGRAFFYPACGFDWRPIRRFSGACDTFVYCDWHMQVEHFDQVIQGQGENLGFHGTAAHYPKLSEVCVRMASPIALEPNQLVDGPVNAESRFLTPEERAKYNRNHEQFANHVPWGRLVVLTQRIDDRERKVTLIYLCAEGVATYFQLFNAQRVAPSHLCIVNCGAGFGFNWTDFRDFAKPLGRAVSANPVWPQYLITDYAEHNWPTEGCIENLGWAAARVYRFFDAREIAVYKPKAQGERGDIFTFAPKNCDACALWLSSSNDGRPGLYFSWRDFVDYLASRSANQWSYLRHDQWLPLAMNHGLHPWQAPMGNLIKIDPIGKLRFIYFFSNVEDQGISEPEQARPLIMAALETLNEAGVQKVAMNGIQGIHRHHDDQIKPVMVNAVRDWFELKYHRSELSIQCVHLVDLRGGFNGVQVP